MAYKSSRPATDRSSVPVVRKQHRRDRVNVTGTLSRTTHRLMMHRALDDDLSVNQILIAGCLAYVRGELVIDSTTGRYMVRPEGPDIVGDEEEAVDLEDAQVDEGASLENAAHSSGGSWDRRFTEDGRRIVTTKHLQEHVEQHLGRAVSRTMMRTALRLAYPMPKGHRYEWLEDSPEYAEVVTRMTVGGGYSEAVNQRLESLKI